MQTAINFHWQSPFRVLVFMLLFMTPVVHAAAVTPTSSSASFYIVAHEDDWQLFMGVASWNDVQLGNANKVIFIHTTAGDGGVGIGSKGQPKPYYQARENGANRAVNFLANLGQAGATVTDAWVTLNHKNLERLSYKNTVTYFLRLPDGDGKGIGFQATGFQSLQRLYSGQIATMTAIDGKLVINGWTDMVNTINAIIRYEAQTATKVTVNITDPDTTLNPVDHSDHHYTALVTQEAIVAFPCINQALYKTYNISNLVINLSQTDQWKHAALWGVTTSAIADYFQVSTWGPDHNKWLGRQYSRVINGSGKVCAIK